MRIGLARGLLYYRYYPFWCSFLENIGFEVIISPETNKEILNEGVKLSSDEVCLPLKAYHGHIKYLLNKDLDFIFLPRIVRIEKNRYTCPKFIGLPDMIKGTFQSTKFKEFEVNFPKITFKKACYSFGKNFCSKEKIKKAYNEAINAQNNYERMNYVPKENNYKIKLAIVGHPYIIFDNYLSHNIIENLNKLGIVTTFSCNLPEKIIEKEIKKYKDISWSYEKEIIGAISYYSNVKDIAGIIYLMSFGCGCSSIVSEIIMREVKPNKPLLNLFLDEHSSDTGILTRLEAFIEMIRMR